MRSGLLCTTILAFSLLGPAVASAQQAGTAPAAKAASPAPAARAARGKKTAKAQGPVARYLGLEMLPSGGSRIFVELSGQPTVTEHDTPGQVSFLMENTHVDVHNNENSLETYYHNTPVLRARLHHTKKDVELAITLRADSKPTFKLVEGRNGTYRLEVDFPPGTFAPSNDASAEPPPPSPTPRKETTTRAPSRTMKAPTPKVGPVP
jgi:hypothetical protein